MKKITERAIRYLIKKLLKGYHLSKNPVRKETANETL